jgi:2-oxoisovalerate dehydrogenase E1 component
LKDSQVNPENSQLQDIYNALKIRFTEQKLLECYSKGLLRGTVHTCVGQELGAVLVIKHLNAKIDWVLSTHRGHGHFLAFNGTPFLLFAELLGNSEGPSKGVGGSQHIKLENFITNGIQGGFMPVANGIASAMREKSTTGVCVNFIGDGTLGEGAVWESLNVAAVFELPTLFVCEDNGIAQSTLTSTTFRGDLQQRVNGFGVHYFFTDFTDYDQANLEIEKAVEYVRINKKPALLHIKTQRLNAHSKGDDNRDPECIKKLTEIDLLNVFMTNQATEVQSRIVEIKAFVESEYQKASAVLTIHTPQTSIQKELKSKERVIFQIVSEVSKISVRESMYLSLQETLEKFEDVSIFGEDIEYLSEGTLKPYGGAFKITNKLSQVYPGRVRNFPIAESSLVGLAIGRALAGLPTIVEIMFGDFITLGFDQIVQNMSKIPSMYGTHIELPVVIRTPMGGGFGYGATHSQSLEKHFLGLPNLTVVATNIFSNLDGFFVNLISTKSPHLVIENKRDYNLTPSNVLSGDFNLSSTGGTYKIFTILPKEGEEVASIITYGGMAVEAHKAQIKLSEAGIKVKILILEKLSPLNLNDFSNLLATKIVIVEEGMKEGGIGAEILAQISESGLTNIEALRITSAGIIGSSKVSESCAIPTADKIYTDTLNFVLRGTNAKV